MTIHATAVALLDGTTAVLLIGPPGSGKSDLALRLIDRGAILIADDRVVVTCRDDHVVAAPPDAIAGLIEVRGIGIMTVPFLTGVKVALVVDLTAPPERLPAARTYDVAGIAVPWLALAPFEASAVLKVERAVAARRETGPRISR